MISALYFSCGKHRALLEMSIATLREFYPIDKIFIADDINDPIGEMEGVERIPNDNSDRLLGLKNIRGMIDLFDRTIGKVQSEYLLKIDSDILVTNGDPLSVINEIKPYAYGCNPLLVQRLSLMHGGAYFLSRKAINDLVKSEFPPEVHEWKSHGYPEDITISITLKKTGEVMVEDNAVYEHGGTFFDDIILTDISTKGAEELKTRSFIHCRNKEAVMKILYNRLYDKK